ncbi:hypothetical protein [Nonomuraea fuscirosea]|uniref:hypothetical protein n=1 Tax=Nonomuraea fuscirosea TaxID=1291556 RepID=UPI0034399373
MVTPARTAVQAGRADTKVVRTVMAMVMSVRTAVQAGCPVALRGRPLVEADSAAVTPAWMPV